MLNVHARFARWEVAVLVLLMTATRFSHEGSVISLPDASLAVFFLAGLYCRGIGSFVALFLLATLIDVVATGFMGISDYCMTPAYLFLLPTYGIMWSAGWWLRRVNDGLEQAWIIRAGIALVIVTSAAFLLSNLSFYAFSGKVSQVSASDYLGALSSYYGVYLGSTLMYAGLGVLCIELTRVGLSRLPKKVLQ